MGFIGVVSSASAGRQQDPREIIWLTTLGVAARAPAARKDIRATLEDAAGPLAPPVGDVLDICVEEMLRGGSLRLVPPGDGLMETTAGGRDLLSLLFAQPTGRCSLSLLGHRLKRAFFDLVPSDVQHNYLKGTIPMCDLEKETGVIVSTRSLRHGVRFAESGFSQRVTASDA
jgi:hypothetical protein